MHNIVFAVFYIVFSYLLGSIPFSYIIGRIKGINLLEVGSKNAGATNVYRNLGLVHAIICFALDLGKGYLAVYLASKFFPGEHVFIILCGLAAILGHTFTPFLKFKGGKGVATGIGLLIFINPAIALICFVLGITLILIFRIVSLASILCSLLALVLVNIPYFEVTMSYRIFVIIAVLYIIVKHRSNFARLIQGKENKV